MIKILISNIVCKLEFGVDRDGHFYIALLIIINQESINQMNIEHFLNYWEVLCHVNIVDNLIKDFLSKFQLKILWEVKKKWLIGYI